MSYSNLTQEQGSNLSAFEMADLFQNELNDVVVQIEKQSKSLENLINPTENSQNKILLKNNAAQGIYPQNLLSFENLISKAKILSDRFEILTNLQNEEKSLIMNKHQEENEAFKKEIDNLKQREVELKVKLEEYEAKLEIQQTIFRQQLNNLQNDLDGPKNEIKEEVNNMAENFKEEKVIKKKMEAWFIRRLDALESQIQDLKEKPEKGLGLDKLIKKIEYLKQRQPWNKKNNLNIDVPIFDQKGAVDVSGTETPWSHYVCFLSQAASEDNTINQAFIVSGDHSLDISQASLGQGCQFLEGMPEPEKEQYGSLIKKLNDSNIALSEKEKLFCSMLIPINDPNLFHVKLDDILNASKASSGKDSLSLDMKSEEEEKGKKKRTLIFNQKMKIGEFKDSRLENVLSPILSSIKNDSNNIDRLLPHTNSFDEGILLEKNSQRVLDFDDKDKIGPHTDQKVGDLDKAFSNISVSDNPEVQNTQKSLQYLQNLLSSVRDHRKDTDQNPSNKPELILEKNQQMPSTPAEIKEKSDIFQVPQRLDDSFVVEKNIDGTDSSFLVDDEIKDFLQKGQEEFGNDPNNKSSKQAIPNTDEEPVLPNHKSDHYSNQFENKLDQSTQKSTELTAQRKVINENTSPDSQQCVGKKNASIPVLDFSKIREKNRQKNNSLQPLPMNNGINITIVDSSLNQSTMIEQKLFEDFDDDDEHDNKKTEKPSDKQANQEEKPPAQPNKTPVKFHNPQFLEEQGDSEHIQLPRPPSGPRRSVQVRSRESLLEDQRSNSKDISRMNESKSTVTTSIFQPQVEGSLDAVSQKKVEIRNKSSDYKNNRNARSVHLHSNLDISDPNERLGPAARALGKLVGKGTHVRQKTDLSPTPSPLPDNPKLKMKQSNTLNSIYIPQNNHLINYPNAFNISNENQNKERDSSNPPSCDSTQNMKGLINQQITGSNGLKRVLTYEDSKMYPTPQKPLKKEFSRRIIPNENMNHLNLSKEPGDDSYMGTRSHSKLDDRQISPFKKHVTDDRGHNVSQIGNTSVQSTAAGHFRAKRFNIKKF